MRRRTLLAFPFLVACGAAAADPIDVVPPTSVPEEKPEQVSDAGAQRFGVSIRASVIKR